MMQRPLIAFVACLVIGCAHEPQWKTEHLTPELIEAHGTKTIPYTRDVAMKAMADALRASGYVIAIENPDRGIIKTDQKLISTTSQSVGQSNAWTGQRSSARAVGETMQFVARFMDAPGGGTTIRLEPKRYRGDTDITTTEPFWKGYLEEQWRRLFTDLEDALPAKRKPSVEESI